MSVEEALEAYDRCAEKTLQLMLAKNHDYGEVWRNMRVTSMTDLILSKDPSHQADRGSAGRDLRLGGCRS